MAFDIMNLFEETEDVLTELDEGNELAAVDFANRIFSERPACTATESYAVYQDDAVIRYAQWFLTCNKELGIDGEGQLGSRVYGLHIGQGRPLLDPTEVIPRQALLYHKNVIHIYINLIQKNKHQTCKIGTVIFLEKKRKVNHGDCK